MVVVKVLASDFFSLFDLPRTFEVDQSRLETRYRDIQSEVHPDRFANAGDAQRRLSMQWATRVNEAYQTLRKPLSRARYLLEIAGVDLAAESNTAMPAAFLMEQMTWRESLGDARRSGNLAELEALEETIENAISQSFDAFSATYNQGDLSAAAEKVRCLMFLDKLMLEIEDALADLD